MLNFIQNIIDKISRSNIMSANIRKTNSYYRNLKICDDIQKREDTVKKELQKK